MANVEDGGGNLEEDEYFRSATDDNSFTHLEGVYADGYNTDTSQYVEAVSLINTIFKQFEGLTPRRVKKVILARTVQS